MNEKPILMSAPMVKAILSGTKTQTRRIANDRIGKVDGPNGHWFTRKRKSAHQWTSGLCAWENPYGNPGDRLWVKETYRDCSKDTAKKQFEYRADESRVDADLYPVKWKPSIFCTRKASRITLEIVSVRVERLQDISEADAKAEGCLSVVDEKGFGFRTAYKTLWETINGPGSFAANPFVWVIEFKKL